MDVSPGGHTPKLETPNLPQAHSIFSNLSLWHKMSERMLQGMSPKRTQRPTKLVSAFTWERRFLAPSLSWNGCSDSPEK